MKYFKTVKTLSRRSVLTESVLAVNSPQREIREEVRWEMSSIPGRLWDCSRVCADTLVEQNKLLYRHF